MTNRLLFSIEIRDKDRDSGHILSFHMVMWRSMATFDNKMSNSCLLDAYYTPNKQ